MLGVVYNIMEVTVLGEVTKIINLFQFKFNSTTINVQFKVLKIKSYKLSVLFNGKVHAHNKLIIQCISELTLKMSSGLNKSPIAI